MKWKLSIQFILQGNSLKISKSNGLAVFGLHFLKDAWYLLPAALWPTSCLLPTAWPSLWDIHLAFALTILGATQAQGGPPPSQHLSPKNQCQMLWYLMGGVKNMSFYLTERCGVSSATA